MPTDATGETAGLGDTLPVAAGSRPEEPELATPHRIGPYRLLQLIGEGGMGEVWLADQAEPRRRVAIKVIKAGMDTKQVVARFESERQALALMDHPAIAKVFDGGSTPEGRPYFVMEYVAGIPITEHCDTHKLSTTSRLELFAEVCGGVQHAHQKAIIHRDLKPSNILVSLVGGKEQPKIIDFGIAKAIGQRLTEKTLFTEIGAIIGTPEYMSPEQAELTGQDVDTRTDVYSLGVILYQLLTGELPFGAKELRASGYEELRRKLKEVEPARPSTKLSTLGESAADVARNRNTEPGALRRQLEGDLDAITMKALEKERGRRYGTPSELAADIARHLRDEPIWAQPPSQAYRIRKYVRRHRLGVGVASALVALLVAFAFTMAIQARRVARERDRANRESEASRRVTEFLTGMFRVSDPSEARGNSVTAREILDRASANVETALAKDPVLQARMMETMGTVYFKLGLLAKAQALGERALETRRQLLGPEDPDTLEAASSLARVLWQRGSYAESEKLIRETLEVRRRVLGPEDSKTLDSMTNLGLLLKDTERPEAEQVLRETFALRLKTSGPENPLTLNAMHNLGAVLQETNKLDEAEKLQQRALEISRRVLGSDHPGTLIALTNLANTLSLETRFPEAEAMQREALERKRRVLGPEHPNTLNAMASLADILAGEGRLDEAEKLQGEALELRRKVIGVDNPFTSLSRYSLARYAARTGRSDVALSWLREAMDHGLDADNALHLAEERDFASLHGDARFQALVEEGKERAAKMKAR
jgi:serine/threonine protein kinase/tetratricopeptide (TPR) repeat protein